MLINLLFVLTAFAEPSISDVQTEAPRGTVTASSLVVANTNDPVSVLLRNSPIASQQIQSMVLASDNLNTYTALLAWKQQNPQIFPVNVKSITAPAAPQQLMEASPTACVAVIVGDVLSKQPAPELNMFNCGEQNGSMSKTLSTLQSTNGELTLLTQKDDKWAVMNNKGRPVDARTYGTVAKDAVVLLKVEQELKAQKLTSTSLAVGSGVLLLSAVIPLSTGDTSQSSIAEDRAWTSLFLIGTAAMMYSARSIPKRYINDRQYDLSNYTTKEKVSKIITELNGQAPQQLLPHQEKPNANERLSREALSPKTSSDGLLLDESIPVDGNGSAAQAQTEGEGENNPHKSDDASENPVQSNPSGKE